MVHRVVKTGEAWIRECEDTRRPMLVEMLADWYGNWGELTYGVSGEAERPFTTRTTSPSSTISAMFSGISFVVLVFFVARSSISGDGANLDMVSMQGINKDGAP